MAKKFNTFGVMIDCSRNAVMSVDSLKRFLPLLKKMGYNCVMLYTEDTYEVEGEPYFGYMRGRYSVEEMKEIDAFAASIGMELIPCIQTLAHLNATFRWGKLPNDCDDILLTDHDRTYEVIDRMFATLSKAIKSRRIHIGMDEANMLGRGRHLDLHGYEKSTTIIRRHLDKITEIAKKYGYELMVWSDMFFRSWTGGGYYCPKTKVPKEAIDSMPKNIIPVYWDYYETTEENYDRMFYNHKQLSNKTWFAGGAWSWSGFMPHNRLTINSMVPAMRSCHKNRIKDVLITLWGDDGAECSHFAQLPSLFYIAECAKGNEDEALIKAKFKRSFGMDFDDFMKIDIPNDVTGQSNSPVNPSKYMLYSDYFNGFLDYTVAPGGNEIYAGFAKELAEVGKKSRKYGYLFKTAQLLCEALAVKYELGIKTRAAYQSNDKEALRALAENDYVEAEKRIKAFARAFEKQWFTENKPHGFDVQDIRLGAIIQRTVSCRRRLLDYVNGKIASIPELETEILPYGKEKTSGNVNRANVYMSVNVLSH